MLKKQQWVFIVNITPPSVIDNVLDVKNKKTVCFKRYYHSKTGRYVVQYRTTATCCECLDSMQKYNDKRKHELQQEKEE